MIYNFKQDKTCSFITHRVPVIHAMKWYRFIKRLQYSRLITLFLYNSKIRRNQTYLGLCWDKRKHVTDYLIEITYSEIKNLYKIYSTFKKHRMVYRIEKAHLDILWNFHPKKYGENWNTYFSIISVNILNFLNGNNNCEFI